MNILSPTSDNSVGAVLSNWLQMDSTNELLNQSHEKILIKQLNMCTHLSLPVVVLPELNETFVNFSRVLKSVLVEYTTSQFWIRLPLQQSSPEYDSWKRWNTFKSLVDEPNKLFPSLELTDQITDLDALGVWNSEHVKGIFIPCRIFLKNKMGFPVLSKIHQKLIINFLKLKSITYIVSGSPWHPEGLQPFVKYIHHLHSVHFIQEPMDIFSNNYEDHLQSPLQPLMDNLESSTYEIFESDPIKYEEYGKAIYKAILKLKRGETVEDSELVIFIIGAGRGPLIIRSFDAAKTANQRVKIVALEKNQNAIIELQLKNRNFWDNQVSVICEDVRFWKPELKADIIISELLGSFGDNELSPECLNDANSFLTSQGIMIPASYTSFISPLMAPILHHNLKGMPAWNITLGDITKYETPYVVRLKTAVLLDKTQSLFTFTHPNQESFIEKSFSCQRTFYSNADGYIHGIAGYFESVLFDGIIISNPELSFLENSLTMRFGMNGVSQSL